MDCGQLRRQSRQHGMRVFGAETSSPRRAGPGSFGPGPKKAGDAVPKELHQRGPQAAKHQTGEKCSLDSENRKRSLPSPLFPFPRFPKKNLSPLFKHIKLLATPQNHKPKQPTPKTTKNTQQYPSGMLGRARAKKRKLINAFNELDWKEESELAGSDTHKRTTNTHTTIHAQTHTQPHAHN